MPRAKEHLSTKTTGIKPIQIGADKLKAYKKATEPRQWAVKVLPKALKINLSFLKKAKMGINQ